MSSDGVVWMRVALEGAHVLIVGGGEVAARKARKFLSAGARVQVMAPELGPTLMASQQEIMWSQQVFGDALPPEVRFVVAATSDAAVNARVAALCARACIPVNVADASAPSTFHMPASRRTRGVEWSLFLGGASPALTLDVMARLGRLFDQEEPWWGDAARALGERRRAWMSAHRANESRAGLWRSLTRDVVDHIKRGASPEDVARLFDDVPSGDKMG